MSIVPVVDFTSCSLRFDDQSIKREDTLRTGRRLVDVLSTVGFVYLTNTGIENESTTELRKTVEKFFVSSLTEKGQFVTDTAEKDFGYIAVGKENLNPFHQKDIKEAFSCGGHRVFNDETKWPDNISPKFSNVIKSFMIKCKILTLRILESLSIGMELKEETHLKHFHKFLHKEGNLTSLRLNYYSPIQGDLQGEQIRLGEHTDYGTITLLFQDNIGGLQLEHNGEFVDAPPLEGAVLINIGDSLHLQSCGQMKSKKHRVIVPEDELRQKMARHSFAYFVHPDNDVVINRPLLYKDEEKNKINHQNLQPPVTSFEYVMKILSYAF